MENKYGTTPINDIKRIRQDEVYNKIEDEGIRDYLSCLWNELDVKDRLLKEFDAQVKYNYCPKCGNKLNQGEKPNIINIIDKIAR